MQGCDAGMSRGSSVAAARDWCDPQRFLRILDDPWFRLVVQLQHRVSMASYSFWAKRNCTTLHLPITTNAVSSPMGLGSDSLPVGIELFGQKTYLADSMQFMLEYGCRFNSAGCFYVMPSFRGERADQSHLCQFYHSEVELCVSLDEAMRVADAYLIYVTRDILEHCAKGLEECGRGTRHLQELAQRDALARISFDEASTILGSDETLIRPHGQWRTMERAGERALLRHFGEPVWVTHWDHLAVPFYQAYATSDQRLAANADLLLGIGEVIGLGERHTSAEEVRRALDHHGVQQADYQWYIEMKASKPLKTSGFGMGIERFLLWVLGHDDIRDLQLLPRFNGQAIVP